MTYFTSTLSSCIGELVVFVDAAGRLARIDFPVSERGALPTRRDPARCAHVVAQLGEYFAGARRSFDLELAPHGTPFQLRVWQALREIPYGQTISYAELARRIGQPSAMRAVGAANGRNPIPIVVPCHRVIGKDGGLTGFGGGLPCKQALLALEGVVIPLPQRRAGVAAAATAN